MKNKKDQVLEELVKVKRTQNGGVEGSRNNKNDEILLPIEAESKTVPSSKGSYVESASICQEPKITIISPHRVEIKILRAFRKEYKLLFEKYCKINKINFTRKIKTMPKDEFFDLAMGFIDEIFGTRLNCLNESTVESIIEALTLLILKDRHKKKDPILEGLDFSELNSLLDKPNTRRTILFFSQEQNACLYACFFLLEGRNLSGNPGDSCCKRVSTQDDEINIIFYHMHELYNETNHFVPNKLQKVINDEVRLYTTNIRL